MDSGTKHTPGKMDGLWDIMDITGSRTLWTVRHILQWDIIGRGIMDSRA